MGYVIYYKNDSADIINFSEQTFETVFYRKDALSPLEHWARTQCFAQGETDLNSFIESNKDKKICFYGAGQYGAVIIEQLAKYENVECVFDRSPFKKLCGNYEVKHPDQIEVVKPDIIVITVLQPYSIEAFLHSLKESKGLSYNVLNINEVKALSEKQTFPDDLLQDWANYNKQSGYNTSATSDVLAKSRYIEVKGNTEEFLDESYLSLKRLIDNTSYSHVFCIRALERGGAEKIALNYMNALYELNPASRILCVCTENQPNYWESKLPANADVFNMGAEYSFLKTQDRADFLFCMLNTIKAPIVHIINSQEAYVMFEKYGHKLSEFSNIYDSQFYLNVTEDGAYDSYPACYMKDHKCITALFSENKTYFNVLKRDYGFPANKFYCHYAPVEVPTVSKYRVEKLEDKLRKGGKLDLLWASRVTYQKRPDVLVKIAEMCQNLPVHFHVWGRRDGRYSDDFFSHSNITYYGPFNDGWKFSNTEYDLFLYTAIADGMPNIVLEALANGFPVLSSNSGGVSEIIANNETGFLVMGVDDIGAYVNKIKEVLENPRILENVSVKGMQALSSQHSWAAFIEMLKGCPDYVFPERLQVFQFG